MGQGQIIGLRALSFHSVLIQARYNYTFVEIWLLLNGLSFKVPHLSLMPLPASLSPTIQWQPPLKQADICSSTITTNRNYRSSNILTIKSNRQNRASRMMSSRHIKRKTILDALREMHAGWIWERKYKLQLQ